MLILQTLQGVTFGPPSIFVPRVFVAELFQQLQVARKQPERKESLE
jgi:hypothetical protein